MSQESNLNALRCEPLLSRIDPLMRGDSEIACNILASNDRDGMLLDVPLFTRLTADAGLSQLAKRHLLSELNRFGIAWLGDALPPVERNAKDTQPSSIERLKRIAVLQLDQPIDVESFQGATAIELQLAGRPFQVLSNSRRSRWTPGLPVEITDFEQVAKRVEVLRVLSEGKCPIGAAVAPGAVYEDLRFLIDSGFDFLTLLADIQFGMAAGSSLRLASLESTLEQSAKAVLDSGTKTKLLVSANLLDGFAMFRCLQLGASAVSIDAYLANAKPHEVAPAKETFGSVLSSYVPAASVSTMAWVGQIMTGLVEELRDCSHYSGETGA